MVNQNEFDDFVYLQALENAANYAGKANPKALIGKVVPKFPAIKNDMNKYMADIENIVNQVNSISHEEQINKLKQLNPQFFDKSKEEKKEEKKDGLPNLQDTENGVVVRFEPAPSGYLHLGHLFSIVANYEIKKKYGGKFILRIADTNPDNISLENYNQVIEDVKWICEKDIDEIFYQSDRIDIYYKYLRTLVETSHAYVCECDGETFKAFTDNKEECPHRKIPLEKQIEMFDNFMNGKYKAGEAVVRFAADIENKNPALRSFSLARINDNPHARAKDKYRVWPTMHLAVAIDDILMNLTHVIRGKDHEINMERQMMIHKALGMKSPHYFHTGRMKFEDIVLSKSQLSEMIENKIYTGWDDPRVPSLVSYRKRGYKPEAFRKFILSLGISKRDSKITDEEYHKGLNFFNKQILEKEANRAFFVHNPKKVIIENIEDYPEKEIIMQKHPDIKERGHRVFDVEKEYFIDSIDFNNIEKDDIFRLMHFGNFKVIEKNENEMKIKFISKEYNKDLELKRNIHFVPVNNCERIEVVMQDASKLKGVCEIIENPKVNTSFQFERFGFVKYDRKNQADTKVFYFTHR